MSSTKERTAQCACGRVQITTIGEPDRVMSCHCHYCQRRTGSVLQVSAWFRDAQIVRTAGTTTNFSESARSKGIQYHFCPTCGSTVYWTYQHVQGYHGIAVGCFNEADFPQPAIEIHTGKRHHWVAPIANTEQFPGWPPMEYLT